MNKIMITILTILSFGFSQSIDKMIISGKDQIESAIQHWNAQEMLTSRAHFERALSLEKKGWLIHYYIAYCNDNLVNYWMGKNEMDQAKTYINDGINHLESSIKLNEQFGESHAMLSSLYGRKIAVMPWAAMYYGPKSGKIMGKALEVEPENPRIHLIMGISAYHTPVAFGGGSEKAKTHLNDAIIFFENDTSDPIMPTWGHSDAYTWLGIIEQESGNKSQAKSLYKKALDINPNNTRVSNRLLPALNK